MRCAPSEHSERVVLLAPRGRDAPIAKGIIGEAGIRTDVCRDLPHLLAEVRAGADVAVITEEAMHGADTRDLAAWVADQPPWSDFPFIVLTRHGGGLERNPEAAQLTETLGNVSFLERPFHPTTLVSVVQTSLRGRRRQFECRRLNEGLEERVQERTGELAAANRQLLAQISERERVESTLRQMLRLEAVGQLTSGVAHDFNNLLTVVLGNIRFLDRGLRAAGLNGELSQRLAYMRTAAERGAKLTDQLLTFSRRQRLEPRAIDLNEVVGSMRDLLQSTIGGSVHIENSITHDLWPALVDPTQLELAVLNLAINARDAIEIGGALEVITRNVTLGAPTRPEEPPAGDYVAICVADNGCGMTEETRAKAFEPFFTTKGVGKGSGLGLSQVLGFAKQSGGGICLESKLGHGTHVYIYLPRAQAKPITLGDARDPSASTQAFVASLLVVDDDNAVREITAATLRDLGYSVVEAGSAGAALELIETYPKLDLMVLDFAMPGMNGAELARQVRAKRPGFSFVFVTGFADRSALAGFNESQIVRKPFLSGELAEKVRQALIGKHHANIVPSLDH